MRDIKEINLLENRNEIVSVIRSVFGENFSQKSVEEWSLMIMNEADTSQFEDYSICSNSSGAIFFAQYGKKEFYHDGSCEPRKFVTITSIGEEEYLKAEKRQCILESDYHEYHNGWLQRGDEHFFTHWQGRFSGYVYYAKNLSGVPFVKVEIEMLY